MKHEGLYARALKPALDRLVALAIVVIGALPGLALALAVRLDSRGPVFYRQVRVGKNGRVFQMLKFRSMVVGAEHQGAGIRVERNDARITRVGRLLRRTSLDELPQVFNILRGEMSVVGPRPGLEFQVAKYTPEQRRRLLVAPGITGWAQVNGRNAIPWDERIRRDLEYVDRISPALDLEILWRTIGTVLNPRDQIAAKAFFGERPGDDRPTASGDRA